MNNSNPGKLTAFLSCKCQKCRKGNVFRYSIFNPLKFSIAYDKCPVCNHKFEEETGFFWGAMYVSYGFSAGLMLLLGIITINMNWPMNYIYTIIIPLVLILSPFSFRYSRMIMLYVFSKVSYDPPEQH
jgi:uncharacterized protein (DUF983 family)